jgi:hypothetical protein
MSATAPGSGHRGPSMPVKCPKGDLTSLTSLLPALGSISFKGSPGW